MVKLFISDHDYWGNVNDDDNDRNSSNHNDYHNVNEYEDKCCYHENDIYFNDGIRALQYNTDMTI